MKDKISIIIPVYNVSKYLPRCVESVLNQTYNNLEIILVNDGSTDKSGQLCNSYSRNDERIKVIHKKNGGPSDARNEGLRIASGKYIGFVDSDDYIEPDMYETLLMALYTYDADIADCRFFYIKDGEVINQKYYSGVVGRFTPISALEGLIISKPFSHNVWNKIYKKKLIKDIEFPLNVHCGEDIIFTFKAFARAKKIVHIDIPKYYHVYRNDSIMRLSNYNERIDDLYQFEERIDYISKHFSSLADLAQKNLIEILISRFKNLRNKHIKKYNILHSFIKNYIKSNYRSLAANPLIDKKNKILLRIFNINFGLVFLFFYNSKDFQKYYNLRIKPQLPLVVQKSISLMINRIKQWFKILRVQKVLTRLLGVQYRRSRKYIEIDITYKCNLKCQNCDRSCSQAPSNERMTVEQIRKFLEDSIADNICWERINIVGGEPTLHPDLLEIINMIRKWRLDHAPGASIRLITNGYGNKVKKVLRLIPDDIIILNSNKDSREQLFDAFNIAPSDQFIYKFADFRNGCHIAPESGIGLSPHGYYPCGPAGAIDRVFGFDIGREKLPAHDDDLYEQLKKLCRLCGHFDRRNDIKVNYPVMSKRWKDAYELYKVKQPVLGKYDTKT